MWKIFFNVNIEEKYNLYKLHNLFINYYNIIMFICTPKHHIDFFRLVQYSIDKKLI